MSLVSTPTLMLGINTRARILYMHVLLCSDGAAETHGWQR